MARLIEKLTPLGVSKKQTPGHYGDGGGLWLQISKFKSKSWVFRYTLHGTRREMGLGPTHTVSLAEARQKAKECRLTLLDGKDPDIVLPAVISYLAAGGAFSGIEKKKFISFFVSQVDRAYEEFDRRQV